LFQIHSGVQVYDVLSGDPAILFKDLDKFKKYPSCTVSKILRYPYLVNESKVYLTMYAFVESLWPFKVKVFGEPLVELLISPDIESRESEKLTFEKLMYFLR